MRLYETTIVIDSQLKPTEIEDTIKKISNFIMNHDGEIVKQEEWGKRRLAYEISKKQYGYYVHFRFQAPEQLIGLLQREYRLSETVLRYLTIKVEKLAIKKEALEAQAQQRETEIAAAEVPQAVVESVASVPVEDFAQKD